MHYIGLAIPFDTRCPHPAFTIAVMGSVLWGRAEDGPAVHRLPSSHARKPGSTPPSHHCTSTQVLQIRRTGSVATGSIFPRHERPMHSVGGITPRPIDPTLGISGLPGSPFDGGLHLYHLVALPQRPCIDLAEAPDVGGGLLKRPGTHRHPHTLGFRKTAGRA